jgi:hypothetical protein
MKNNQAANSISLETCKNSMELLYVFEYTGRKQVNHVLGVGGSHITAGLINTESRKVMTGSLVRKPVYQTRN